MKNVNEIEEEILKFWEKNRIFEKSVKKKSPKGHYIFYDGPPFITGLPHYATLLPSIVKDAVPRFWTMKGFKVERVWGWDCHGLPAENKVEKELGLKNKKDIEKLGVKKFVDACKFYVNDVSGQWKWYIDRIARWVDMNKAYKTMDTKFMESVIWAFKKLYDKKLIYEGYRTSLHCPRCATPLSKFEITMDAGSYKDVTETSVIVEFQLRKEPNTFILAWTTTPWTLPGNLALAVNNKIDYVKIKKKDMGSGKEINFILAKDKLKEIFGKDKYKIAEEFKGKKLVGLEYVPIFDLKNKNISESKTAYKVYHGDFVNVEEGTGIVHIAPNFGEDDFATGEKYNLPIVDIMDESGMYTSEAGEWKDVYFKKAGEKVLEKLKEQGSLFSSFPYTHSYPFCYRCSTPLIYKTQKAWYVDIEKIRKDMIKTNKKINWIPDYFKEGRFNYNLENAPPWCISRSRYWGSPIPVWKCDKCEEMKVAGSIEEIEKWSKSKVTDLHRPKIDEVTFKCKCKGTMRRVPEILDCWFESGSMPYAQWHYPFERKEHFEKNFPADFIIEYTGQLRGWFYYLHVLSNSLFNSECFKNVIVTGVLAGTDGRKMSKSYGNYPDPKGTLEKYGGDALRMYFLSSPIMLGEDMSLNEKDLEISLRKNVMLLRNVYNFYETLDKRNLKKGEKNILDKWIIIKLNNLTKDITKNMEKYNLPDAVRPITDFIENLSLVYVKFNRDRFNDKDKNAIETLKKILDTLSRLIAPFMPFIAEEIWQKLNKNNFKKAESVHLKSWPKAEKVSDKELEKNIEIIKEIISFGLKKREELGMGLKWPLAKAKVKCNIKIGNEEKELIKLQLNVKDVEQFNKKENVAVLVELDSMITPALEAEGYARELSRQIQAFRKKLGLNKEDEIELIIFADKNFKEIVERQKEFIATRTNSKKMEILENVTTGKERFKNINEFKIKDKKGEIAIVY